MHEADSSPQGGVAEGGCYFVLFSATFCYFGVVSHTTRFLFGFMAIFLWCAAFLYPHVVRDNLRSLVRPEFYCSSLKMVAVK